MTYNLSEYGASLIYAFAYELCDEAGVFRQHWSMAQERTAESQPVTSMCICKKGLDTRIVPSSVDQQKVE